MLLLHCLSCARLLLAAERAGCQARPMACCCCCCLAHVTLRPCSQEDQTTDQGKSLLLLLLYFLCCRLACSKGHQPQSHSEASCCCCCTPDISLLFACLLACLQHTIYQLAALSQSCRCYSSCCCIIHASPPACCADVASAPARSQVCHQGIILQHRGRMGTR